MFGRTSGAQSGIGRVVARARDAVHHFENSDLYTLDPFDYLDAYIAGSDVNVKTYQDVEIAVNEAKRLIKIPTNRTKNILTRELKNGDPRSI